MDIELLKEIGDINENNMEIIEFVKRCIYLYEETIKAMGLYLSDDSWCAIDND
ncbi:MAG: hypothetical protein ACP5KS_08100 [Candidatus Hydrogenedens sp.]